MCCVYFRNFFLLIDLTASHLNKLYNTFTKQFIKYIVNITSQGNNENLILNLVCNILIHINTGLKRSWCFAVKRETIRSCLLPSNSSILPSRSDTKPIALDQFQLKQTRKLPILMLVVFFFSRLRTTC